MYPRCIVLFIILCSILFAMAKEKGEEPLAKCKTRCDRLFVKHQLDKRGKQTCYERCTDDPTFFDNPQ